jgi:hypothetical protein
VPHRVSMHARRMGSAVMGLCLDVWHTEKEGRGERADGVDDHDTWEPAEAGMDQGEEK